MPKKNLLSLHISETMIHKTSMDTYISLEQKTKNILWMIFHLGINWWKMFFNWSFEHLNRNAKKENRKFNFAYFWDNAL